MWLFQFVSIALSAALALSSTATAERVGDPIPITSFELVPPANNNSNNSSSRVSPLATLTKVYTYDGIDFNGGDLTSVAGRGWRDCGLECKNHAHLGCDRFTWTDYNGGTCWLKKWANKGYFYINSGAVSGILVGMNSDTQGAFLISRYFGHDMFGNDLYSSKLDSDYDCHIACYESLTCVGYAYLYSSSVCYFKWAASPVFAKDGVNCGLLFRHFQTFYW